MRGVDFSLRNGPIAPTAPRNVGAQKRAPTSDRLIAMRPHVATPLRLALYVPHPESSLCASLARGSAIVGLPLASGQIRIYYEGNIIGAADLKSHCDKAVPGAGKKLGRHPGGYPTREAEEACPT